MHTHLKIKLTIAFIISTTIGAAIGIVGFKYQSNFGQWFSSKPTLYQTRNDLLENQFESLNSIPVQWSQLLPESEKEILKKYQQVQASTPTEFADNILLSIQASTDKAFSAAMMSANSVDSFDEKAVSIAGFIVPIDYGDDKSLRNIFVVPYFGACLHFPPPPPNQMVFAQLGEGFIDFNLTQAYRLHGVLRRGLFEDPLGTSAYILDVVYIEPFYDHPDNVRQH